jgi:hypothetical protein
MESYAYLHGICSFRNSEAPLQYGVSKTANNPPSTGLFQWQGALPTILVDGPRHQHVVGGASVFRSVKTIVPLGGRLSVAEAPFQKESDEDEESGVVSDE